MPHRTGHFWGVDASAGKGTVGVSGRLKSIVNIRFLWLGKRMNCAKNGWTDLHNLYVV